MVKINSYNTKDQSIKEIANSIADVVLKDKYGAEATLEEITIPKKERGRCIFPWCNNPADEYWCTENLDYFKVHGGKKDGAIQRGGGGNLMRTCRKHTWWPVDICKNMMEQEAKKWVKKTQ